MTQDVFSLLKSKIHAPLTLIDVGAAGGAIEGWRQFGDKARIFCFEARENEASDLAASNADSNIEYVPLALAADDRGIELTVTAGLPCSSVYPPIERIYGRYPGNFILRPVSRAYCPSTTLDGFLKARDIERVHGIKLDTQGSELDILKGAERALERCLCLIIECEFNPLYKGQPLFCDVDRFLRDRGFVLWRFANLAHYSPGVIGGEPHTMVIGSDPGSHHALAFPNGQLFWADALYVRETAPPVSDATLPFDEAVAGAALVAQWRLWDLAVEMVRKSGDAALTAEILALLGSSFVERGYVRFYAEAFRSPLPLSRSVIETAFDQDGCVIYGPYVRLPYGEQEITFHVRASGLEDGQELAGRIWCDVAQDLTTVALTELTGQEGARTLRRGEIKLLLFNSAPHASFEFRIFTSGHPFNGKLAFYGVSVEPVCAG